MENQKKKCSFCGAENEENALYCSSCGKSFKNKTNESNIWKTLFIVLAIIVGLFILVDISSSSENDLSDVDFYNTCIDTSNKMEDGAEMLILVNNKIIDISNNCGSKTKSDSTDEYTLNENGYFINNLDAIDKYMTSQKYQDEMNKILQNRREATELIEKIRNSTLPEKYKRLYADLEILYLDYINLIESPYHYERDVQIFSDTYNTLYDTFFSQYRTVISYYNQ